MPSTRISWACSRIVERAAQLQLVGLRQADPRPEESRTTRGRPTASVALVRITVGTLPNSCSRSAGPTSIGAAASVDPRPAAARRLTSIQ